MKEHVKQDDIIIRSEMEADFADIRAVVRDAFLSAEYSDEDEHNLVERIRKTDEYIPELSLVALKDGKVVGYAMMSRITIGESSAIGLAPLAVHPDFQCMGIGKSLIKTSHSRASALGYNCCVILGDPGYYSKFGYVTASEFNIYPPFEVPDQYYMVCPLIGYACLPSGTVRYSQAFNM